MTEREKWEQCAYLLGVEFSLETLARNGRTSRFRVAKDSPHFIDRGAGGTSHRIFRISTAMRDHILAIDAERRALKAEVEELRKPMTRCLGCQAEIDEETCWCGDPTDAHGYTSGHSPVPMGCVCHLQLEEK